MIGTQHVVVILLRLRIQCEYAITLTGLKFQMEEISLITTNADI